tara:strand:- start:454 stop:621 length:168 start_codon:yes stop_codon:yes gene_type:complete
VVQQDQHQFFQQYHLLVAVYQMYAKQVQMDQVVLEQVVVEEIQQHKQVEQEILHQ